MRRRNMRFVYTGLALIALCIAFFFVMLGMAPKSNDPVELMPTVGQICGIVGGIGIVMAIIGLVGKKVQP